MTLRLPALLLLALVAAFAAPGTAAAAAPCWKQVVDDWMDNGRIDRIYEDECYAKALEEIPDDLREYSALEDEIAVAREFALRDQLPPDDGDERVGQAPPFSGSGGNDDDNGGGGGGGPIGDFFRAIGPKNADDVPLPLLVLGGIATLLMATGAAGMVARRTSARRIQGTPPA